MREDECAGFDLMKQLTLLRLDAQRYFIFSGRFSVITLLF